MERRKAFQELPAPKNLTELRRIIGMVKYLDKVLPNLPETIQPMTELLKKDNVFAWDNPQENSFKRVKELLTQAPILSNKNYSS